MILRGIDIAGCPAHIGAQLIQRLDQHRCLDGHVQAARNPGAFKRLLVAVLFTQGHESGHLGFGNCDFFAAKISLFDIGNVIIVFFQFFNNSVQWCISLSGSGIRARLRSGYAQRGRLLPT